MKAPSVRPVRCAIYTRVSTDHGLDQEFNSLDAQYDAASPQKSELRVAIAVGLRAQSRLPGTEFLDAETKRQKSPLKCANAYRDQNPGSEWPEIPAKTPYLASHRKRAVCKD